MRAFDVGPPSARQAAKRHLNGGSLVCWWWPAFSGIGILSPLVSLKKNNNNNNKTCQSWTTSDKFSGSWHAKHHLRTDSSRDH